MPCEDFDYATSYIVAPKLTIALIILESLNNNLSKRSFNNAKKNKGTFLC